MKSQLKSKSTLGLTGVNIEHIQVLASKLSMPSGPKRRFLLNQLAIKDFTNCNIFSCPAVLCYFLSITSLLSPQWTLSRTSNANLKGILDILQIREDFEQLDRDSGAFVCTGCGFQIDRSPDEVRNLRIFQALEGLERAGIAAITVSADGLISYIRSTSRPRYHPELEELAEFFNISAVIKDRILYRPQQLSSLKSYDGIELVFATASLPIKSDSRSRLTTQIAMKEVRSLPLKLFHFKSRNSTGDFVAIFASMDCCPNCKIELQPLESGIEQSMERSIGGQQRNVTIEQAKNSGHFDIKSASPRLLSCIKYFEILKLSEVDLNSNASLNDLRIRLKVLVIKLAIASFPNLVVIIDRVLYLLEPSERRMVLDILKETVCHCEGSIYVIDQDQELLAKLDQVIKPLHSEQRLSTQSLPCKSSSKDIKLLTSPFDKSFKSNNINIISSYILSKTDIEELVSDYSCKFSRTYVFDGENLESIKLLAQVGDFWSNFCRLFNLSRQANILGFRGADLDLFKSRFTCPKCLENDKSSKILNVATDSCGSCNDLRFIGKIIEFEFMESKLAKIFSGDVEQVLNIVGRSGQISLPLVFLERLNLNGLRLMSRAGEFSWRQIRILQVIHFLCTKVLKYEAQNKQKLARKDADQYQLASDLIVFKSPFLALGNQTVFQLLNLLRYFTERGASIIIIDTHPALS